MRNRNKITMALLTAGLCAYGQAQAAGFQINELSPSLQGQATAGAGAATNDVTAMAYNPATLTTLKHTQAYVGASEIMPKVGYTNAQGSVTYPFVGPASVSGVTSESSVAPNAFVPNAYFGSQVNDSKVYEGIAITAPFGLETSYDPNWVGRSNALDSDVKTIDIAPTLAYQASPFFSVGLSLHLTRLSVNYTNAAVSSLVPAQNNGNVALTGNAWAVGYSIGMLITPEKLTHIGISYRTFENEEINGTATVTDAAFYNGSYGAQAQIQLPDVFRIDVDQELTQVWHMMATAQWTHWDRFQSIDVTIPDQSTLNTSILTQWKNSWLFALGTSYQLTQQWLLRAGVAYDETPTISATRDPRIPGSNREWVTLGATYQVSRNFSIDAVYEHIFMNSQSINVTQTAVTENQVSADYTGHADIVGLGLRYTF